MTPATPAVDSLHVTRTVPASVERVFRAWITPEDVRHWFGRWEGFEVSKVDMDVRVGGAYRIEVSGSGFTVAARGVYREVDPPNRLAFTWAWEEEVNEAMTIGETLVVVELRAVEEGTEVSITHERLLEASAVSFHRFGWNNSLERLDDLVREEA
jgi:uncharacterized protein YndB with AHSA1/START domain